MSRQDSQHALGRAIVASGSLVLWPWDAEAHLITTGLWPIYDGIGHLLVTPETCCRPWHWRSLQFGSRLGTTCTVVLPSACWRRGVGLLAQCCRRSIPPCPFSSGTLVPRMATPPRRSRAGDGLGWCTAASTRGHAAGGH